MALPGTERFRQRLGALNPSHFRSVQGLWASSIGLGTYLGDADDRTDALYGEAIRVALSRGCNVLDTAINYRCQRSERIIGRTLAALIHEQALSRDEVILCTKGGYLAFDGTVPADPGRYLIETIFEAGLASPDDLVAGCHCLAPAYLDHALKTSLHNLRVETIDGYYLHNPEQQLEAVSRATLLQRLEAAFGLLEQRVQDGAIRSYGVATWQGLRANPKARRYLSLEELAHVATRVGGTSHHFKLLHVPDNLAMPAAHAFQNQTVRGEPVSVLEAAQRLGLSVVVSASLLQSRLARPVRPRTTTSHGPRLDDLIPGLATPAQRAIQFVRSTPGVTTALVGMKERAHVEENLALAASPMMSAEDIAAVFDRTRR